MHAADASAAIAGSPIAAPPATHAQDGISKRKQEKIQKDKEKKEKKEMVEREKKGKKRRGEHAKMDIPQEVFMKMVQDSER